MRMILIVSLSLVLLAIAGPLVAAELSGTVFKDGVPTGNLSITVEGQCTSPQTETEARTDARGGYRFHDLQEGNCVLIIRGKPYPVTVKSGGTRYDIRF